MHSRARSVTRVLASARANHDGRRPTGSAARSSTRILTRRRHVRRRRRTHRATARRRTRSMQRGSDRRARRSRARQSERAESRALRAPQSPRRSGPQPRSRLPARTDIRPGYAGALRASPWPTSTRAREHAASARSSRVVAARVPLRSPRSPAARIAAAAGAPTTNMFSCQRDETSRKSCDVTAAHAPSSMTMFLRQSSTLCRVCQRCCADRTRPARRRDSDRREGVRCAETSASDRTSS